MSDLFNPQSATDSLRQVNAVDRGSVTTLSCRSCGGAMRFGIDRQHVECTECGQSEAVPAVCDDVAPLRRATPRPVAPRPDERRADARSATSTHHEINEITCPTCGGDEIFVGTLASTRCPFCAGQLLRSDAHRLDGDLRVDGIIPFQVEESDAHATIERWVKSRHLAPDSFSSDSIIESLQSVYLGAYLFDLTTTTQYRGQRGDVHVNSKGEKTIKWQSATGTRRDRFGNAVVIASDRVEPEHSRALSPWPFEDVRDFDPGYLTGHLSHTVDQEPEDCVATALDVIDDRIKHSVKMVIGGDEQRIASTATVVEAAAQRHLLVPVWISTISHHGDTHHVVVNGATGTISGTAPRSNLKIALYITLAVFVVLCFVVMAMTIGVADGVS